MIKKSIITACEEDAEGQNYNEVMKECVRKLNFCDAKISSINIFLINL